MPVNTFGWRQAIGVVGNMARRSRSAVDAAIRDEAAYFMRKVAEAFRTQQGGSWAPLSPITLMMRRGASRVGGQSSKGTKALVHTGDLRKSIQLRREGHASYFVGVHRTAKRARGSNGKPSEYYANIARIHETGISVIPITEKMRRYFRYLFWKGVIKYPWPPKSKQYIVIKQRSFIRDTAEKFTKNAHKRALARYWNHLGGLGKMKVPEE